MGTEREATRRDFLRWMGLAPGAAAALAGVTLSLGCGSESAIGGGGDASGDADANGVGDGGDADLVEGGEVAVGDVADEEVIGGVCEVTGRDVEGPFFVEGAPQRAMLAALDEPGERLSMSGLVYGPDCMTPLSGALLDIWQADSQGDYHGADEEYRLRAQLLTGPDGTFAFETIRPGRYPQGRSFRPAHIHFTVTAPGHQPLTTQMYFAGDPFLAPNDPCGGCNSGDETLIIDLEELAVGEVPAWRGRFEIVLARVG